MDTLKERPTLKFDELKFHVLNPNLPREDDEAFVFEGDFWEVNEWLQNAEYDELEELGVGVTTSDDDHYFGGMYAQECVHWMETFHEYLNMHEDPEFDYEQISEMVDLDAASLGLQINIYRRNKFQKDDSVFNEFYTIFD